MNIEDLNASKEAEPRPVDYQLNTNSQVTASKWLFQIWGVYPRDFHRQHYFAATLNVLLPLGFIGLMIAREIYEIHEKISGLSSPFDILSGISNAAAGVCYLVMWGTTFYHVRNYDIQLMKRGSLPVWAFSIIVLLIFETLTLTVIETGFVGRCLATARDVNSTVTVAQKDTLVVFHYAVSVVNMMPSILARACSGLYLSFVAKYFEEEVTRNVLNDNDDSKFNNGKEFCDALDSENVAMISESYLSLTVLATVLNVQIGLEIVLRFANLVKPPRNPPNYVYKRDCESFVATFVNLLVLCGFIIVVDCMMASIAYTKEKILRESLKLTDAAEIERVKTKLEITRFPTVAGFELSYSGIFKVASIAGTAGYNIVAYSVSKKD